MNGNITKEGIKKDLEWMDRAGIAGFHVFDAGLATPQVVDRRLVYMTPEWKDAFNYALDLADSLGLSVTVASSPGWSVTGGPWVSEEDGEKKLVWRTIDVAGGGKIDCDLPEPLSNPGPYQDIPYDYMNEGRTFYRDLFVLAVRIPDGMPERIPYKTRLSDPAFPGEILNDGVLRNASSLNPDSDGHSWVEFRFDGACTMRTLFFTLNTYDSSQFSLEYRKTPDSSYETLTNYLPVSLNHVSSMAYCSIPEVEAVSYRLICRERNHAVYFSEAWISPEAVLNLPHERAGFYTSFYGDGLRETPVTDVPLPAEGDVVDISGCFRNGRLSWDAPAGKWRIYRFGYGLQGHVNGPASPEATGLEVDKLDPDAVRRYYSSYLGMYEDASGGRLGKSIRSIMIDSYESGRGNWTASMEEEFRSRRGYDLRPWAPVLTGQIIGSVGRSEQFLFDWRQTLGELIAENHYDIVNDILAPYGMTRFTESHEYANAFVGDGMMPKRKADVPMAAIWVRFNGGVHSSYPGAEADIRESSSVAHIYGQNICAAESFTCHGARERKDSYRAYRCAPFNLKAVADAEMAQGLNRFVIHTSVHQPVELVPGLGLGVFGQWFNRHETWAEEARPWTDYLSRSCFLLQQGRWVADIAWFYGEDRNLTSVFDNRRPEIPRGYNYDFVNADILLHELESDGGTLSCRGSGMNYRILVIDRCVTEMSAALLERIAHFARKGVAICGPKPLKKAGLAGTQEDFDAICSEIWDSGKYKVYSDCTLSEALAAERVAPDFSGAQSDELKYVHRTLGDGEIFWLANNCETPVSFTASFNVSGKKPELWRAEDGSRSEVSYRIEGGRTSVDLELGPDDAVFVMFLEKAKEKSLTLPAHAVLREETVGGPWTVTFQEGRGAPESAVFDTLASLSESPVEGIRYFSGTASYATSFALDEDVPEGARVELDLGEVHHMARVFVNGKDLGLLWKKPYKVDIASAIVSGQQTLELRVIDSWANRMTGDARKPEAQRITYTSTQFYYPDDEPVRSGLIGPVKIQVVQ